MNKLKQFFHSLPLKLSVIITTIVLVTFVVMCGSISYLVYKNMYNGAIERSNNAIDNIVKTISINKLNSVEETSNIVPTIENSLDDIEKITNFFLVENSWAAVAKLAYLEGKGEDCAYISYRDSQKQIVDKKFTDKDDYVPWDWYQTAKNATESGWSEPSYNRTQKKMVITYFCPVRDIKTGEIIAIWAVDAEYINLSELISDYLPYSEAYGYIVDNNGTYMSHPNKECELYEYDELDEKYKNKVEKKIYDLMMSHGEGSEVIEINGKKSIVIYQSIPEISASLAIVCPFSVVFKDVFFVQSAIWKKLLIAIVIVALSIFLLIYLVMRPLRGFAKAVKAVARGKYNAPLPNVTSNDELRDFHDAMHFMQQSLESNIEQLKISTAAAARIDNELMLAKHIQQNLLSHNFTPHLDCPQIDLYAKLQPARAVGGDLYDFFIRDSKLFFTIADVSGKGVPASLFMAMAYKVFRVIASKENSSAALAEQLNAALAEQNKDNMFVTMFIGVLDLLSGELCYTNAGHNPPLIISDKCSYMDVEAALPIAAFANTKYTEYKVSLKDGTALLLYTDGVVEAENSGKELYGEDRLLSLITDSYISSSDIVEKIYSSVIDFSNGADQSDDITILCLSYNTLSISFDKIEKIDALPSFVESLLQRNVNINEMQSAMLNLALEELIVNVLQYSNSKRVNLSAINLGDKLKFTLIDSGIAFDPTLAPEVDISLAPSERKEAGGLGIHFAKEIFSCLEYKRICNLNVLYAYFHL